MNCKYFDVVHNGGGWGGGRGGRGGGGGGRLGGGVGVGLMVGGARRVDKGATSLSNVHEQAQYYIGFRHVYGKGL